MGCFPAPPINHLISSPPFFESVVVVLFTVLLLVSSLDRLKRKCKKTLKDAKNALEGDNEAITRNDIDITVSFMSTTVQIE